MAEPVTGITAIPDESNARYFHVKVEGPKEVRFVWTRQPPDHIWRWQNHRID